MSVSPARVAAFKVLLRIERDRAFSSVLLPEYEARLSPQDRGLCHELVLGTLRRQILLDRVIAHFAKGKRLDLAVRIAIRLGLYQIFFLDRIPPHSAVNESVSLVQQAGKTSAKGFVNAVLRNAIRNPPELIFEDAVDRISVETSHPRWLIERWVHQFGEAEAAALAHANNSSPGFAFRFIGGDQEGIEGARPSAFVPGCWLIDSLPEDPSIFAKDHQDYFQDEGSQMVAAAVPPGQRFLDVCAAPGGKTGFVATRGKPAYVAAGDLYRQRVEMLRENCSRQGADQVTVLQYNAERSLPFADESFDAVLVDAPCSGTGTIRHNPEIRYFLSPPDIETLPQKQLSILVNASKTVRRGGTLIYSTCSLETEENEAVVEVFLGSSPDFNLQAPNVLQVFITGDKFARTLPPRDAMDGFFIAVMQRN